MKKITLIVALLAACFTLNAQTVRKDASGNYVAVTSVRDSIGGKPTGKTFTTSKGDTFPVYESKIGKLYVIRVSKNTGKEYKQYLKLEN